MESRIKYYMQLFPQVKKLKIKPSNRDTKRFIAEFELNGIPQKIHFGQRGAYTYFDGAPKEKMLSYRARASKIKNKKGRYTYNIPGSANSFAYYILW